MTNRTHRGQVSEEPYPLDVNPETGYFSPSSVSWRIHSDPAGWFGGGRALLLQALHPVAMAVFTQNTRYEDDPWGRLFRTADFFVKTIFEDRATADRAAAKVRAIHKRAEAIDPQTGAHRRADEPDLLLWIHATAVDSFIAAHRQFGGGLSSEDADTYVGEMGIMAELLGLPPTMTPRTTRELDLYLEEVRPTLGMTDEARDAARWILFFPPVPKMIRPVWFPVTAALISSLPEYARQMYGLPWIGAADFPVRTTIFTATRLAKRFLKPPPSVIRAQEQMKKKSA